MFSKCWPKLFLVLNIPFKGINEGKVILIPTDEDSNHEDTRC